MFFYCYFRVNNHGAVKTFTVRYKCCYGYKRNVDAGGSCEKGGELKQLMDTLDDIKADEFKNLIKTTKLEAQLAEGNFSFFVPSDHAMNLYNEKINEMVRKYLKYHEGSKLKPP